MGFFQGNANTQWAAALLLVPKDFKVIFRMAVDLGPTNVATEAVFWLMPHMESEIYEVMGTSVFATMDFVSGY